MRELDQLRERLRAIGIESELVEGRISKSSYSSKMVGADAYEGSYQLDMGGIKLKGTNVDSILVTAEGHGRHGIAYEPIVFKQGRFGEYEWLDESYTTVYDFDYVIRCEASVHLDCEGQPSKRFPRRVVDYTWRSGRLGESLSQDDDLRKRLVKAKAPPIEIKGNHIYVKANEFPSDRLFQCIDRIAEHMSQEASTE